MDRLPGIYLKFMAIAAASKRTTKKKERKKNSFKAAGSVNLPRMPPGERAGRNSLHTDHVQHCCENKTVAEGKIIANKTKKG